MSPGTTVREGVGSHKFNAADDAYAMSAAKVLHAGFYDPAVDLIVVWELLEGEKDRHVGFIEGPNA